MLISISSNYTCTHRSSYYEAYNVLYITTVKNAKSCFITRFIEEPEDISGQPKIPG
jgi:hypothetical protein